MANVHGQRSAAGIRVDEDVVFLKNVIQRYASPWSKTFFVDGENGSDDKLRAVTERPTQHDSGRR